MAASGSYLDLGRAPYILDGVKYIDPVSLVTTQAKSVVGVLTTTDPDNAGVADAQAHYNYSFVNQARALVPPICRLLHHGLCFRV